MLEIPKSRSRPIGRPALFPAAFRRNNSFARENEGAVAPPDFGATGETGPIGIIKSYERDSNFLRDDANGANEEVVRSISRKLNCRRSVNRERLVSSFCGNTFTRAS